VDCAITNGTSCIHRPQNEKSDVAALLSSNNAVTAAAESVQSVSAFAGFNPMGYSICSERLQDAGQQRDAPTETSVSVLIDVS
jgi:hypothetical protein